MNWSKREARLLAYLLHELSESEREALDFEMASSPELLELAEAVEETLFLEYLEGRLDGARRRMFDAIYLTPGPKHARYRRARIWWEAARAAAPAANARETPCPRPARRWFLEAAIAAAGLGGAVLWWRKSMDAPLLIALTPGRARDAKGRPLVVSIPAGTREVRFDLVLPRGAAKVTEAVIGTPERPGAWRGLVRTEGPRAELVVPAASLPPGDYTLELLAAGSSAASYEFRLTR